MSKCFGKIIISGEHAAVYGKLALAASIGLGVTAKVLGEGGESNQSVVLTKAIEVAGGGKGLRVEVESEIPVGAGLGSSAAVAAAVITTVRDYLGKPVNSKEELFNLVMECEKVAHGNPSGIDAAVVVYGGLIAFTKGNPIEKLTIEKPVEILLVDTGKPAEATREMVELVAQEANNDRVIEQIGQLSLKVKKELTSGNSIDELLDQNGKLLEELGVVGVRAKQMSQELRELGASVKVTGAGGVKEGSGMLLVRHKDFEIVRTYLESKKIRYYPTKIGEK
jgi:mevalonate kinase